MSTSLTISLSLLLAPLAGALSPAGAQTPAPPPRPARPAPRVLAAPPAPPVRAFEWELPAPAPAFELELDWSHWPLLEVPLPPEPVLAWPEPPLPPEAPIALDWDLMAGAHAGFRAPAFARQEPRDSLYRRARELLNRGDYRRAAEMFQQFEQKNPGSGYLPAAMYWRAFALYRAGTDADLRQALQVLDEQRQRFASAATDQDVIALVTRVTGALASRGDAEAARRLREGTQGAATCDREDMEVRAEALTALVQTDPEGASEVLRRTLARKDDCTVPLRRRAVYLIGRQDQASRAPLLLEVARTDPSDQVRSDAIGRLGQLPAADALPVLEQLFTQSGEERIQRAVLQSLRRVDHPDAAAFLRRVIEREDVAETLRAEAIHGLGRSGWAVSVAPAVRVASPVVVTERPTVTVSGQARGESALSDADATFLRSLYGRTSSSTVRRAILETMARTGGAANDQWLMGIVRNPAEDLRYRSAALGRLRRSDVPVAELGRLYDALTERELRATLVSILGSREEDAATDKLIEIAKTGTDPSIRRAAISALARKKDPRTTKLLLELVER